MYFPALTALRAVFVGMVVGYHGGLPLPASLGVTGFFVLSGFLITSLLLKEFEQTRDISLRDFYLRRAFRIFPAYYAFLALSIGADLVLGNDDIKPAILPGLTYLINYYNAFNDHPNTSIAHAWSLAVEEQFYLLWPLAMLMIVRKSRAALPWILVAAIIAVLCWRTYAVQILGKAYAYNAFDTRFDSLAVGCLLATALPHYKEFAKVLAKTWLVPPVLFLMWFFDSGPWRFTYGFTLASLMVGVLLVQMMNLYREPLWRWLEWGWVKYLGTISYGIYLYSVFGSNAGIKLIGEPQGKVLGVGITIAMAACSYHVMEKPLLKIGHTFRKVPAPA